ncbi:MAG: imidazole glycerol phosphate synthase subunit HisF [Gammaproteobacteria bacterium]|nr:MAG: imidazole glycerol phosphate synthase subunit HisF [Gammaproteobacteria bacterium]
MLAKRIIPCLDVKHGQVVKGIQFRHHKVVGDIVTLARLYAEQGADELVFYDITASVEDRCVDKAWVRRVAEVIDIPFCVAGGIRALRDAETILTMGADKISINSPALEQPALITELANAFGQQCIVVGIDSYYDDNTQQWHVYQYTGDEQKGRDTGRLTQAWIQEVQDRGAGEIVLNTMNHDGIRSGYDIHQLKVMRSICQVPLIASGGAGALSHFAEVFQEADVDGALAASVFHKGMLSIPEVKSYLQKEGVCVREPINAE